MRRKRNYRFSTRPLRSHDHRMVSLGPKLYFDRQDGLYRYAFDELSSTMAAQSIDPINGVIRGCSIITSGVVAKGHELHVDMTTLKQMEMSAKAKGQIPVKWNHQSGADSIAGHLVNFRVEGNKLLADMVLLKNHRDYNLIIEMAEKQAKTFGLSAAFAGKEETRLGTKYARCDDLVSVDVVAQPAANPGGLFQARVDNNYFGMRTNGPELNNLAQLEERINHRFDELEGRLAGGYDPELEYDGEFEDEFDDEFEDEFEDDGPDLSGMSEQEILYHYQNGDLTDADLQAAGFMFDPGEAFEDEYDDEFEDEYDGDPYAMAGEYNDGYYGDGGDAGVSPEVAAEFSRLNGAINYFERLEQERQMETVRQANAQAQQVLFAKVEALIEANHQLQAENQILHELSAGPGEPAVAFQTDGGLHVMHGLRGGVTEFHEMAHSMTMDGKTSLAQAYRELMARNPMSYEESLRARGVIQ